MQTLPPLSTSPSPGKMDRAGGPKATTKAPQQLQRFILFAEGIEDLFYDGQTNPDEELLLLQHVLDVHAATLSAAFGKTHMSRTSFHHFVKRTISVVDQTTADEIFSCATSLYETEAETEAKGNAAQAMTAAQFAVAVVRLANLFALINDGMVDTSKLSNQTEAFLVSIAA
jgi:hypothetical protein